MGLHKDLTVSGRSKSKEQQYYDDKIKYYETIKKEFLQATKDHLYLFSPLLDEEEEDDLVTVQNLLKKYVIKK